MIRIAQVLGGAYNPFGVNLPQSTVLGLVTTYRVVNAVLDAIDFPTTKTNARPVCIFDVVVDDGAAASPAADSW